MEGRDVAEIDALAFDDAHLDVAKSLGLIGFAIEGEGNLAVAGVNLSHRDFDVTLTDCLYDVGHGEAAAGELVAVDVHDDLALHTADEVDAGHAGQGGEAVAQFVVGVVIEFVDELGCLLRCRALEGVTLGLEDHRDDGRGVDVKLEDLRLLGVLGQIV